MFTWSTARRGPSATRSSDHGSDPSSAMSTTGAAITTATPIYGSVRPPPGAFPGTTALSRTSGSGYTRTQHLDSFLKNDALKRSTRKVSLDDTSYDTVFQTVSAVALILRIHIPPSSSSSSPILTRPPILSLAGIRARHPWLNAEHHVVGYPPVASEYEWQHAGMLLGNVIQEVVKHFQLHPPDVLEIRDTGLRAIQPVNSPWAAAASPEGMSPPRHPSVARSNATTSAAPPTYDTMTRSTPKAEPMVDLPSIPNEFPEIARLSKEELEELLQDELALHALAHRTPVAKELQRKRFATLSANAQKAEKHLAHEQEVQELYQSVTMLQQELVTKVSEFRVLEAEQDRHCAPADRTVLVKALKKAAKGALEESEAMAEEWLDADNAGETVDEFLTAFLEIRTLHHLREAKLEVIENNGDR